MARDSEKRVRGDGELGARLRRRRKALGLTAKELARVAGVSASYVSQLEHGKQDQPSLEVLTALAAALGVPTAELIGEPVARPAAPTVPPALAQLAADLELDARTTAMLAGINLDGYQPPTRDGWLLVLLAIRHACAYVDARPTLKRDGVDAPVAARGDWTLMPADRVTATR